MWGERGGQINGGKRAPTLLSAKNWCLKLIFGTKTENRHSFFHPCNTVEEKVISEIVQDLMLGSGFNFFSRAVLRMISIWFSVIKGSNYDSVLYPVMAQLAA